MFHIRTSLFVLALSAGLPFASATPVTVQEVGVGAHEIANITSSDLAPYSNVPINVYAGVIKLLVDGVPTNGFCIDPFHMSPSGPLGYNTINLSDAPKPPGPMGVAAALKIEQLWQQYYTPAISDTTAAGLQIAIWEIVDQAIASETVSINGNDFGASTFLDWVNTHSDAAAADLVGLTGPGQDYVVQRVPDTGWTIALLGVSFIALIPLRRKLQIS